MRTLLLLLFTSQSLWAAELQPVELRVCLEDKQVFHLYNRPGQENSKTPGILVDFVKHVGQKHKVKINIIRRPATACRVLMKAATVDAYAIISYTPEREDWAVYPRLPNSQVDPDSVFNRTGYFLYSLQDKDLPWDGKNLEGLKGLRIGSSEAYSINDDLKKAGVLVESFKSQEAMYTRLHKKQLDGMALHSNRIDKKLAKMGLRKYEIPLKMNDYYVTFSKPFYRDHKDLCEKIWKDSVLFEETPEGKKAMANYEPLEDFPPH